MTFNKILSIVSILFFFMISCEKEMIETASPEAAVELESLNLGNESPERSKETAEEVVERMRQKTIKFLELTGEPIPAELSENAINSRSPYYAYNSGTISDGYLSFPNNISDPLSFGTRRGTTQWISLTLNNNHVTAAKSSGGYGYGALNFDLNGVGQLLAHFLIKNTISFNFAINAATQTAVVTPTTSANLHSRYIPNTSFTLDNPLSITIHSNTNGWLWVEVKKAGTTVFSSLYRYNYNTGFDSRNGGTIRTTGFSGPLPGPLPPYGPSGFTTNYAGYCGWF